MNQEKLVEGQPTACLLQGLLGVGEMNLADGRLQVHQVSLLAQTGRQMVGQALGPIVHRPFGQATQPAAGDAFGERVDGDQTPGVNQFFVQRLPLRRLEGEATQVLIHLAAEDDLALRAHLLFQIGLIEPGGLDGASAVSDDAGDEAASPSRLAGLGIPDGADDRYLLTVLQLVDGLQGAVIIVAAREEIEQVTDGGHPQALQAFGVAVADARQNGDR